MNESHFRRELQTALTRNASGSELADILRCHRDAGLTQQRAYDDLRIVRQLVSDDPQLEDRVLELMDLVTGFCSPHARLWSERLET